MKTYQDRLAQKLDIKKRKLIDLAINHAGSATDAIRIRLTKNDEGDITSRIIEKADVIHVIFPPMIDIPYRRLSSKEGASYEIISPIAAADDESVKNYEIYTTHNSVLRPDDLIIRIMQDPEVDNPIIICLQVLEALGTFGGTMLIRHKYKTNLYNEKLPDEVINVIYEMVKRRIVLGY